MINATTESEEHAAEAGSGLLTKDELAPRLRRSTRTVDSWMKAGRLPYLKIGRSVLFSWPQVIEKLNAYRIN